MPVYPTNNPGSSASGGGAASGVTNTPAGTIAATDVQAALDELDTEKVPVLDILKSVRTTDLSMTVDTMVSTGLSVNVVAGGIYEIRIQAGIDYGAGWMNLDFNGGTATVTDFRVIGVMTPATATAVSPIASAPIVALATATAFGVDVQMRHLTVTGCITVNGAGTFIPRAGQFSTNVDPTIIFRGASMILTKLN